MERDAAERIVESHGYDPRYLDEAARFAFLQACQKGPRELIEAMLVCGMPIRATTDREPAIIKAAESGILGHVQLILARGGSLETQDFLGDTALHTAANWGHAELVGRLIELGAATDTINGKKWTPLSKALDQRKTAVVDVLLENGADPDYGTHANASPIAFAKDAESVGKLLAAGADPNLVLDRQTGSTLLLSKTGANKTDEVSLLLKHGAKDPPNRSGWTAAMVAADRAAPKPELRARPRVRRAG